MTKNLSLKVVLRLLRAALLPSVLMLAVFGQPTASTAQDNSARPDRDEPFAQEVKPETNRRFISEHSFDDPAFRKKHGRDAVPLGPQGPKHVRMVYLIPSDKPYRKDYQIAIGNAILHLQNFYQSQMGGGYSFSTHAPIVEVYRTSHAASFYSSFPNNGSNDFFNSVLSDGFALSGGGFNDPNNRWIYYVDADPACNQNIGGVQGVALLAANDLRGLTGEQNIPPCGGSPDNGGVCRWIGGLGHELGHAFGLPHPPGCDQGSCTGGSFAYNSLMYVGYSLYPGTYLLQEDKNTLFNTGFFTVLNLDGPRFDCAGNPIDDQRVFVRVQYLDFLEREPEQGGWDYWTSAFDGCGGDAICIANKRVDVARAFWESDEFRAKPVASGMLNSLPPPEYVNSKFVELCYRIHLQRAPNDPPEYNFDGYNYWLGQLNGCTSGGEDYGCYHGLIRAFIESSEYRARFP